jgi:hypothetical protein
MVAVGINTPLNLNNFPRSIRDYRFIAPVFTGLIVVDADTSIVATWSTPANLSGLKIRPGGDWLQDRTFGAGINTSLYNAK